MQTECSQDSRKGDRVGNHPAFPRPGPRRVGGDMLAAMGAEGVNVALILRRPQENGIKFLPFPVAQAKPKRFLTSLDLDIGEKAVPYPIGCLHGQFDMEGHRFITQTPDARLEGAVS